MSEISIPKIKAIQLLNSLGITKLEYLKYLKEICYQVGPRLKYENISGSEGRLVVSGKSAIITVPFDENYQGRTRFSIAHELGHYVLHMNTNNLFNCSAADMTQWKSSAHDLEFEANVFASELLIPSGFLNQHLKDNELTFEFLKETANKFSTSLTATIYKMIEVTNRAAAVVVFKDRKASYFFRSKPLADEGFWIELGPLNTKTLASQIYKAPESYLPRQIVEPLSWVNDLRASKYLLKEEVIFFKNLGFGMSILEFNIKH